MKKPEVTDNAVDVNEIVMDRIGFWLVGVSPLVPHAVSFKAKGQLLFPSKKKNQTERDTSMKHQPFDEFRDAAYKFRDDDEQPTRLYMPGAAFHSALAASALNLEGVKKSQVGRLTSVDNDKIPVWGVPQIYSTIVRSSDMARTPDVRTLPILRRWATRIDISFVASIIKPASLANLLGAAGQIVGIGDGRPEKGKLAFGKFRITSSDDPELLAIMKTGGREFQDPALADPQYYDAETDEILSWFKAEIGRRIAAPPKATKPPANGKSANVAHS